VSWTIDQVFRRILPGKGSFEWTDGSGHLHLLDRAMPFAWAGKRIVDMLPSSGVRLVAVTRATVPSLDVADLVGQEGDMLHLMVVNEAVENLQAELAPLAEELRR
jgi:trk system potassium uptake protein TrkA